MVEKASYSFERSLEDVEAFHVGPFSPQTNAREWSYKSNGSITGVMITWNANYVCSLVFRAIDQNGIIEYSNTFGNHNSPEIKKTTLEWPQEYFTSINGTSAGSGTGYTITSICFNTNQKKYGPFGPVRGNSFDFPVKGRTIVGFYGQIYNDRLIYGGLGVYFKHSRELLDPSSQVIQVVNPKIKVISSKQEECIKLAPCGWSRSTEEWSYMLTGATEIKIGFDGNCIKWISFKSPGDNAEVKYSKKSNTSTDEKNEAISVKWPDEYLISISGTLRDYIKDIESLCFYTNRTMYGPFGTMKSGTPFSFNVKGGIVVGFHGSIGDYFDTFGVYLKSYTELSGSSTQGQTENAKDCSCNKDVTTKGGLSGGQEGTEWSYKPNGAITEITVSHGWVIDSLSFKTVDKNGKSEYSESFGGEGGDADLITIDWPREYLTSISGTHHTFKKQHIIESLCFHTNKEKYGPYGCTKGSHFDISLKDRVIVGFHGRANSYINAIGVYHKGLSS